MDFLDGIVANLVACIKSFFGLVDTLTWGWSLIPMLIVFGLLFTIVGGFAQFKYFGRMFNAFRSEQQTHDEDAISSRQALFVSIGGRVGGGNIAGVAVAISLGGPGAVFWMWAVALVGMMTSIIECTLAQLFKRKEADGSYRGGPATYIIHGLGEDYRWLAVMYAIALTIAYAVGFNAFQGNTMAGAIHDSLKIDRLYIGIFLAIAGGFVIFGGIKRIARVSDIIVPLMACIYLVLALAVIALNITQVPALFASIIKNAFGLEAVVSGGMGAAIAQGMRRGLFSNEAGLGSAPNIAATAKAHHPVSQGISQSLSVFIDTILICSATAFIVLLGSVYEPGIKMDGVVLTQQSLVSHFGVWVSYILSFSILLFSFSSVIYNYYMGENGLSFLFGDKAKKWIVGLKLVVIGVLFMGAIAPGATAVFFFSDPLMGILALTNLLALIMLFPTALRVLKDYRKQLKAGVEEPVFDPAQFKKLDIDPTAWE